MLTAKKVDKNLSDFRKVMNLYTTAFPLEERMPKCMINLFAKREMVEFLAFYDGDVFVGLAYLIHYKNTTLLLYFAIEESLRGKGYGSQILSYVAEHGRKNVVLYIEEVDERYKNFDERVRRRGFYEKNGYRDSGRKIRELMVVYDCLSLHGNLDTDELSKLLAKFSYGYAKLLK